MVSSHKSLDSGWREALAGGLDDPRSASRRLLLFFEARGDLFVEVSSRTGSSTAQTRHSGLSAQAIGDASTGGRWVHLSEPGLDDVRRLTLSALDPGCRFPKAPSGPPAAIPDPAMSEERATAWIDRIHGEIARLAPSAQAHSRWVQFDQRVLTASADRGVVEDRRRGCRIHVQAWTEGTNRSSAVIDVVLRPRGPDSADLAGPGPEDTAARLVERLHRRTRAREAPTGPRTVILGPGAGGVLVHEIVGHALEADTAQLGSWLTDPQATVAPKDVSIIDDPRRGRAPWRFDDEGQPALATPLVGGGRVRSWLCDRATARRTGREPTGHGRRSSFRDPVRPRMGCTFVAAGRLDPEEVLAGVDGIYVRRLEAATVDPVSGRATFRVTDADVLNAGAIEAPLRSHLLVVDARAALAGIDRVADDLTFDSTVGSCQRDGQSLAISVGAPTIRIGLATVIA